MVSGEIRPELITSSNISQGKDIPVDSSGGQEERPPLFTVDPSIPPAVKKALAQIGPRRRNAVIFRNFTK